MNVIITERTYLKKLRERKGYTLDDMKKATGFTLSKYYQIEHGKVTDMKVSDIDIIAYALGVKTVVLLQAEVNYLNSRVSKVVNGEV